MGEIKSTLEIALEKAKAVEISSEDRKRFRREKVLSRARDLFRRYTDHPNRSNSLADAIDQSGKDAPLLTQGLAELFLGALDLSDPSERIWQGLQELGLGDTDSFQEAFDRMAADNERARKEGTEKLRNTLTESLAKSGISGTAVDPNIEESPLWKNLVGSLNQKVTTELHRLRQEIANAIKRNNSLFR